MGVGDRLFNKLALAGEPEPYSPPTDEPTTVKSLEPNPLASAASAAREDHTMSKTSAQCDQCQKYFTSEGFLLRHKRQIHGAPEESEAAKPRTNGKAKRGGHNGKAHAGAFAGLEASVTDAVSEHIDELEPGDYTITVTVKRSLEVSVAAP